MLTAAASVALGALPAGATPAVSGLASNYWWAAEQGPSTLPAPPSVPAGGLWVSSNPAGPQAVSAVRFVLPQGTADPVLSLVISTVAPSTGIGGDVMACPTTSAWPPGPGPSPWTARPAADCQAGQVVGAVSADGHTLSFDLAKVATAGVVDVVLEPAPAGPLGSPTFDVSFQPVTGSDVSGSVPPSPTATPPAAAGSTVGPAAADSVAGPSDGGATTAAVDPSTGAATTPALAPVAAGAAPASAAPAAGPSLATPNGSGSVAGASTGAVGGGAPATVAPLILTGRSWRDRILLGLAIADIAGYLMWSRRPKPAAAAGRTGRPPALR